MLLALLMCFSIVQLMVNATPQCFLKHAQHNLQVSACTGDLKSLSLFTSQSLIGTAPGIANLADAILSRGDGIFDWNQRDLTTTYVCSEHLTEFGNGWEDIYVKAKRIRKSGVRINRCGFPEIPEFLGHSQPVAAKAYRFLSKQESQTVLSQRDILVPAGTPLCNRHSNFVNNLAEPETSEPDEDSSSIYRHKLRVHPGVPMPNFILEEIEEPDITQAVIEEQCDPNFAFSSQESYLESDTPFSSQEQTECQAFNHLQNFRKILLDLAREAKVSHFYLSNSFTTLTTATKARRARATRSLLKDIIYAMAPDSPNELENLVVQPWQTNFWLKESSTLHEMMTSVQSAFQNAANGDIRKQVLSLITPHVTFAEVQKYIPGLSAHYFKASRLYAKISGPGSKPSTSRAVRIRYNARKLDSFVDFITSSHVVIDLPFGTAKVKSSQGLAEEIPNVVRVMLNERIVSQYLQFLTETNQQDLAMSRSSLLKILKVCTARTRKSLHGLDYITYAGMEGFDSLIELTTKLPQSRPSSSSNNLPDIAKRLLQAKQYLKGDFKLHIKEESRIADHCASHALSDSKNKQLSVNIANPHEHNARCQNCEEITSVIDHLGEELQYIKYNDDTLPDLLFDFSEAKKSILEWKAHQLRAVHQDKAKDDALRSLSYETDVFLHMDWAMKMLPTKGREHQAEWFGKRGISWHITVALVKVMSAEYQFAKRVFIQSLQEY